MIRRKSGFWKQYEDLALSVLSYGQACDFCAWFITNRCLPRIIIEEGSDRVVLVDSLILRYETLGNYETCTNLLPFKNGFYIPENVCNIRMENYIYNTLAVLNYNINIEECSEVFCEYGLLAFNPWITSAGDIDFVELADLVFEYLQQKGDLDRKRIYIEKEKSNFKFSGSWEFT
ncbi:MAG: hypothetical protein IPN61_09160 [Bacteroidetes bacterium]|nr:hypothetical protein [Bacteroidota bacterium]